MLQIESNGIGWKVTNSQTKQFIRVYNNTGATISQSTALAIQSSYNGIPSVTLPIASGARNQQVVGLAYIDIPIAAEGIAISGGILSGLNLTSYNVGDILYLSDTIAGGYVSSTSLLYYSSRTNQIGYVTNNSSTLGTIQVQIVNEDINLSLTDIQRNILEGNVISTGTYEFLGLTAYSSTTFNIASMKGWIVNNTGTYSATHPTVNNVIFPGATGVSALNITSSDNTYVLIGPSANVITQNTFPTPQQRRENIYLGKVIHSNRVSIQNINNTVDYDVSPVSMVRDIWTPLKLINDGVSVSANGVNLSINISSGYLWGNGINWTNNQLNPNQITFTSQTLTTFQYRTSIGATATGATAGTFLNRTTLLVDKWESSPGVLSNVGTPNAQSTNIRVYAFPTGLIRLQFGQKVYSNLTSAAASVNSEDFDVYANNSTNGILIGVISVVRNASDLSNSSQALFTAVSKFGEVVGGAAGGASTVNLQQAFNNSATNPDILTSDQNPSFIVRNGDGADTTNVLIVQSLTGSTTFQVTGAGNVQANKLQLTGVGLTSGLGRYLVVDGSGNSYYQTLASGNNGEIQFNSGGNLSSNYNLYWDNGAYGLGLMTNSPTHTITLGNLSTGIAYYNTVDQSINFERNRQYWSGSVYYITQEAGGTASVRAIFLGQGTTRGLTIARNGSYFNDPSFTSTNAIAFGFRVTMVYSTGTSSAFAVAPTINTSGSGGSRAFMISPYLQSLGSGVNNLLDVGTNTLSNGAGVHSSLFTVNTSGLVNINNLTPSKLVFTDSLKNLTSTGIGSSSQFIKGDGSLDSSTYLTTISGLNISQLNNDSSYITASSLIPYITSASVSSNYQTTLTSGVNIKTINGSSVLGSGNLVIIAGAAGTDNQIQYNSGSFLSASNSFSWNNSTSVLYVNGSTGFLTSSPTHTITLGNTSTGIVLYNTSDQTTLYERFRQYWTSTTYYLSQESGGTASVRSIFIGQGTNRGLTIARNGTSFNDPSFTSTTGNGFSFNTTIVTSSGLSSPVAIIPTINQSGTAGYRGLYLSLYEQAIGSGNRFLLDLGTNTTAAGAGTHSSVFSISSVGKITQPSGTNQPTGQATLINGTVSVSNTQVTANSIIILTNVNVNASTAIGTLTQGTIVAGTSFVVNSRRQNSPSSIETSDQSTFRYWIIN